METRGENVIQQETTNGVLEGLVACVQKSAAGERCLGALTRHDATLVCSACQAVYPVTRGVAIIKPDLEARDKGFYETHYAGRSRQEQIESEYLRHERDYLIALSKEKKLTGPCLEIGCGVGMAASCVPNYVGMEYSLAALTVEGFEAYPRVCADARRLPFQSGSLECIFTFNTLEHVPEVHLAFAEIDRVCKPGGYLVLSPAWHCTRYNTELIPVLPYAKLNARQKMTKALLPVIRSRLYKLLTRVPPRILRHVLAGRDSPLHWRKLNPYYGDIFIADCDACASLDSHDAILYYTSRGYECLSHRTLPARILAGHDMVLLRKAGENIVRDSIGPDRPDSGAVVFADAALLVPESVTCW